MMLVSPLTTRLTTLLFPYTTLFRSTFSPDGRMIGFVRSGNMYVYDIGTGHERRLTTDGGAKILNGRLDWVYQEELYGRGNFERSEEHTSELQSPCNLVCRLLLDEKI